MSLGNALRVVSPEVIKGITIHSPCCHSWVSHLWDVAISRIPVFCVKWTLSADQAYQCNCTIAVQSQTWWPVWDPQREDELCVPMILLGVMAARASKGQPELHTRTQRCNEKSCTCSFLVFGIHPRGTPWEFIPSQLHLPQTEGKFRGEATSPRLWLTCSLAGFFEPSLSYCRNACFCTQQPLHLLA